MKKRIVVKIGSSSLTDEHGGLSKEKLTDHVEALAYLKEQHHDVILISSGAVAAGFTSIGYPTRPVTIEGKQAAAAVGQGLLIEAYTEAFKKHGITPAQLLLTRSNFQNKQQYSNVYATLDELLKRHTLPIINENDSVAVDELTFGDNDRLSALVSGLVHADYLIILTDVDGIYEDNPRLNPDVKRYDFLPNITKEHVHSTEHSQGSKLGTGGMKSKLLAAQTALSLGVNVFIGKASGNDHLLKIIRGEGNGTYIGESHIPTVKKEKQWIAFHSDIAGEIEIDHGAEVAILEKGKSLLPAGIHDFQGDFQAGDVVLVTNSEKKPLAKGIANYSSDELKRMQQDVTKSKNRKIAEFIHRDQLVINTEEEEE